MKLVAALPLIVSATVFAQAPNPIDELRAGYKEKPQAGDIPPQCTKAWIKNRHGADQTLVQRNIQRNRTVDQLEKAQGSVLDGYQLRFKTGARAIMLQNLLRHEGQLKALGQEVQCDTANLHALFPTRTIRPGETESPDEANVKRFAQQLGTTQHRIEKLLADLTTRRAAIEGGH